MAFFYAFFEQAEGRLGLVAFQPRQRQALVHPNRLCWLPGASVLFFRQNWAKLPNRSYGFTLVLQRDFNSTGEFQRRAALMAW